MSFMWKPYVPVAERRRRAEKEMKALAKKTGRPPEPVVIEGRAMTNTFWGRAWCENLERYSDFANRLPRGRTYARNGSVVDLSVEAGKVQAWVQGSELYRIEIGIAALPDKRWRAIVSECAGQVGSLVELLEGRFGDGVMEVLARERTGMFPAPDEIELRCSCPDWANMCKHVAAALYGVGARLDHRPELLFTLRRVDQMELVAEAGAGHALAATSAADRLDGGADLGALFGIELDGEAAPPPVAVAVAPAPARRAKAAGGERTFTIAEIVRAGVPRAIVDEWITAGTLAVSGRGAFTITPRAERAIATLWLTGQAG